MSMTFANARDLRNMKEIRLEENQYDDEALHTLILQGFHYPTAILQDCIVIVDYEHLEIDSYDASNYLREMLHANSKTKGIILFVHNFTKKLMRISIDTLAGIEDKVQLN